MKIRLSNQIDSYFEKMGSLAQLLAKVWDVGTECVVVAVRVVPHRDLEEAVKSKPEF